MDAGDAFDHPWDLLDAGRPEDALRWLAERAADGAPHPEGAALACLAHLDLGDLEAAGAALGAAPTDGREDDAATALARGELALAHWRPDAARVAFERAQGLAPSAHQCLRLALCADLADDRAAAERWTAAARALDADGAGPVHVDEAVFEHLLAEAAAELPGPFAARLDQVPVLVEPVPTFAATGPDVPPDTLGLFRGASDLDGSEFEAFVDLPAAIHLYQRNLERRARSHAELREEIRITLFHELGHLLGFDEDGVDAMGLA